MLALKCLICAGSFVLTLLPIFLPLKTHHLAIALSKTEMLFFKSPSWLILDDKHHPSIPPCWSPHTMAATGFSSISSAPERGASHPGGLQWKPPAPGPSAGSGALHSRGLEVREILMGKSGRLSDESIWIFNNLYMLDMLDMFIDICRMCWCVSGSGMELDPFGNRWFPCLMCGTASGQEFRAGGDLTVSPTCSPTVLLQVSGYSHQPSPQNWMQIQTRWTSDLFDLQLVLFSPDSVLVYFHSLWRRGLRWKTEVNLHGRQLNIWWKRKSCWDFADVVFIATHVTEHTCRLKVLESASESNPHQHPRAVWNFTAFPMDFLTQATGSSASRASAGRIVLVGKDQGISKSREQPLTEMMNPPFF